MPDVSERQLGLLPEGADECRAALHGAQPVTGAAREMGEGVGAVVGKLVMSGGPRCARQG